MPKGVYPMTKKNGEPHPAGGKSINKYDAKGNERKPRKSRAKDPERFKKAVEEKTGYKNQFKGLLGKIVQSGVDAGNEDLKAVLPVVKTQGQVIDKELTHYHHDGGFANYQEEGVIVEKKGGTGGELIDAEPPLENVSDINDLETIKQSMTKLKSQGGRGLNINQQLSTFRIPAKHRKALRKHIKENYADEYGIGRDGVLSLRKRARAKTQEEKDSIKQAQLDAQNQQIQGLFDSIGQVPVDKNANISLQQANVSMKIAEKSKTPLTRPPLQRSEILSKAQQLAQLGIEKGKGKISKTLQPFRDEAEELKEKIKEGDEGGVMRYGSLYDIEKHTNLRKRLRTIQKSLRNDFVDTGFQTDYQHLGLPNVPLPPESGFYTDALTGLKYSVEYDRSDPRDREGEYQYKKQIYYTDNDLEREGIYMSKRQIKEQEYKNVYGFYPPKDLKDIVRAREILNPVKETMLPKLQNPLPLPNQQQYKYDYAVPKKIKIKKKLIKKKVALPSPLTTAPPSIDKKWDETFTPGWSKGYLKELGAKGSKFLTLSEAKAEASKHPKVRAITKQKTGKTTYYTLRGGGSINAPTGKGEMTILFR